MIEYCGGIDGLTLSDWAVLGVLRERDAHGFALAKELAPDTELGRIWTVRRSLVYHALGELEARGLARELKPQSGDRGPSRTPVAITTRGRRALARWLGEPVSHIRDYRHQLLLKLAFTKRAGKDPSQLIERQLEAIDEILTEALGRA